MTLALKGKKKSIFLLIILFFLTTYGFNEKINFPFLKINKVELINTFYLEENIKDKIIEHYLNRSLLNINKIKLKNILLSSKWVKNFSVKKKYPSTILIQFEEYKPVALFLYENDFFFINESFNLTDKKINYQKFKTYPIYSGEYNKDSFYTFYNFLIKANYLQNIKEIKYNSYKQWELNTNKNLKILFGDYDFKKQFKTLNIIINKNKEINLIDLRIEDRVVVSR